MTDEQIHPPPTSEFLKTLEVSANSDEQMSNEQRTLLAEPDQCQTVLSSRQRCDTRKPRASPWVFVAITGSQPQRGATPKCEMELRPVGA